MVQSSYGRSCSSSENTSKVYDNASFSKLRPGNTNHYNISTRGNTVDINIDAGYGVMLTFKLMIQLATGICVNVPNDILTRIKYTFSYSFYNNSSENGIYNAYVFGQQPFTGTLSGSTTHTYNGSSISRREAYFGGYANSDGSQSQTWSLSLYDKTEEGEYPVEFIIP